MSENSQESEEIEEIIETARDYYWDDETQSTVTSNQLWNDPQLNHHLQDTPMEEEQNQTRYQNPNPLDL